MSLSKEPICFNDFINIENLVIEHKEFTFTNTLLLERCEAEYYCQTNKFDFNDNVIESLKKYFYYYVPKYTSAFFNSNINGNLFIGVDDYGFVKGIPYQGKLPEAQLRKNIYNILLESVKNTNDCINFKKLIKVNFLKVQRPKKPTTHNVEIYQKYLLEKEKFNKAYEDFIIKLDNWRIRFNFFTQRLIDLVNNYESRIMIIDYIRKRDPKSSVISLLESNFKLIYCDHDTLKPLKEDINNPYYWVCAFKDDMVKMMRNMKPIFKYNTFFPNTAINLINSCNEMIPYWIHYNNNMNLYLIHIEFNTPNLINDNSYFYYKEKKSNKWIKCYRTILPNGEPSCKPF